MLHWQQCKSRLVCSNSNSLNVVLHVLSGTAALCTLAAEAAGAQKLPLVTAVLCALAAVAGAQKLWYILYQQQPKSCLVYSSSNSLHVILHVLSGTAVLCVCSGRSSRRRPKVIVYAPSAAAQKLSCMLQQQQPECCLTCFIRNSRIRCSGSRSIGHPKVAISNSRVMCFGGSSRRRPKVIVYAPSAAMQKSSCMLQQQQPECCRTCFVRNAALCTLAAEAAGAQKWQLVTAVLCALAAVAGAQKLWYMLYQQQPKSRIVYSSSSNSNVALHALSVTALIHAPAAAAGAQKLSQNMLHQQQPKSRLVCSISDTLYLAFHALSASAKKSSYMLHQQHPNATCIKQLRAEVATVFIASLL